MKEHDEGIPVKDNEIQVEKEDYASTIEKDQQIEDEVNQKEQEDQEKQETLEEPQWDGSESEFVEDDDAEEYEEKYAGIKLGYVLKKDEIMSCLKHTGMFKSNETKTIVEICLLFVLAIMFFVLFFLTRKALNAILGVVSVVMAFAIYLMPRFFVGFNAEKLTTGKKLSVEIYPNEIKIDKGASSWSIPLDGTCFYEEFNDMLVLYLPQEKLFVIPMRAIEPDLLADVQAMIIAGTTPKEEE